MHGNSEIVYVALLFGLFVVPKLLQRLRLPAAITSLLLGVLAAQVLGLFRADDTLALLATFGISSLFLFAGLEVDMATLRRGARLVLEHVALRVVTLALATVAMRELAGIAWRPAIVVALALLTPSTGFILDSLPSLGLGEAERSWVKAKAVATEILALAILFVVLRSATPETLALSGLAVLALVVVVPVLFKFFAERIAPHAPNSEFAFLLMLAVVCAYATRRLGVYYLVGAFLVGVAARRFRQRLPAMASEKMLHAVEVFASVFVPFYFFTAGVGIERDLLTFPALGVGLLLTATVLPLRLGGLVLHRRLSLGEDWRKGFEVGVALLPTLVFTLVLTEILGERFEVPHALRGGLVIYTIVSTALPAFLLRRAPLVFEAPHASTLPPPAPPSDRVVA